jgi:hypothetical protein
MAEHQEEAFIGCQDKKKLKHLQDAACVHPFIKLVDLGPPVL